MLENYDALKREEKNHSLKFLKQAKNSIFCVTTLKGPQTLNMQPGALKKNLSYRTQCEFQKIFTKKAADSSFI